MTSSTADPVVAFCRTVPPPIDIPGAKIVTPTSARALSRSELLTHVRGVRILVTWVSEKVNAELLDAAGASLRGVCNFAVGTDNIDLGLCKSRGITVTNTPDAVTQGTADLAWALILAVARRIPGSDAFARSARYPQVGPLGPDEFLGQDLTGKTLFIVGAGRIGYAVALRSIGWGMRVIYAARKRHLDFEMAPLAGRHVTLEEGLREADVISVHTPLTESTRHLIDARALSLVKPGAILINTARGPVIDESALVDALRNKKLWGAGLDVFEREPEVHPGLIELDNCVLTPHIGSASIWSRTMMTRMVCENARAILAGREPPNRVA